MKPARDTVEFAAAAIVGAAISVAAVQLLRPDRPAAVRVRRRLRKPIAASRDSTRAAAGSARKALDDSGRAASSLGALGREFVRAASDEVGEALHGQRPSRSAPRLGTALERLRELARSVR